MLLSGWFWGPDPCWGLGVGISSSVASIVGLHFNLNELNLNSFLQRLPFRVPRGQNKESMWSHFVVILFYKQEYLELIVVT